MADCDGVGTNEADIEKETGGGTDNKNTANGVEIQQLKDEFNFQRAKMKDLFLQKEDELKRMACEKSSLQSEMISMREQMKEMQLENNSLASEIQSLQMLVHETMEAESTASSDEVKMLIVRCTELEQKLNLANKQAATSQDLSLAPSALVQAVTKSIARRLGTDPNCQDNLEDSMRKVKKYAQEDAEVLRSLVVPLEEEIVALKGKLRDTDSKLQEASKALESGSSSRPDIRIKDKEGCDMCLNYEAQLVSEQAKCKESEDKAQNAEIALKMARAELERLTEMNAETLSQWQSARADGAAALSSATVAANSAAELASTSAKRADAARRHALAELTRLAVTRETAQDQLREIQMENERLVGKFLASSVELQSEDINLPDSVPELQEHALRLRETAISAMVGRERALEAEETIRTELRAQLQRTQLIQKKADIADSLRLEVEKMQGERDQMVLLGDHLRNSQAAVVKEQEGKKKLEGQMAELRSRVSSLQQELDNSEKVQQDFVRLSQSLQMQLERIRESEAEVRWQHEDDVEDCPACGGSFGVTRRKQHCRHCGRVFCAACVSQEVAAGPRRRKAHVCRVCHTLLVPHAQPYFSTEVPHTPDS